jgi:leucyl aminopeptidase
MKIQLSYARPSQIETDVLVVILDKENALYDLGGSPLEDTVRRVARDFEEKRIKKDYYTTLDAKSSIRSFLVTSTSLIPAHNVWENVKTLVARSIRLASDLGYSRVAVLLNTQTAVRFVGKAVEGAILGSYTFDKYRMEKTDRSKMRLELIVLKAHDSQNHHYVSRYTTVSDVVNEAREMINEPGSVVTPQYMADAAHKIARDADLDIKVWDERRLEREGFNGLLQVGRGSIHPPRLIRVAYRAKKAKHHLVLVGKGVTFDTGGISIKPADKMFEMKGDMSGGAAVLYAMKAIGKLKPPINVTGIVPSAENFPDARAQRPGDIFYAKNGKSIMVDNTDAEGRLILTDGLYLAGSEKATHIVDIATLTGACVRALGLSIAGIMGNDPKFIRAIIQSGQNHGETFWELPLPAEYKDMLKTPYADINNIGGPVAGALTAGLFLQEFVPDNTPWAHLDIAGPFIRDKDWKYYEAGAIGFGVKTLVDLAERFNEYVA